MATWIAPYLVALMFRRSMGLEAGTTSFVLASLTSCIAGTVVCLVSVLNFSLAATLSIAFGFVLPFRMTPTRRSFTKILHHSFIFLFTPTSIAWLTLLVVGEDFVSRNIVQMIWEWKVLRVWTLPFLLCIYFPLVLQASIAVIIA
jgi:glycosylphosphatidylinositol transamidase